MDIIHSLNMLRRDYGKDSFSEKNADRDPVRQFELWFQSAVEAEMYDPNAMVLTTASREAKPSSRVVLLKNYDQRGFVFFSNYESRKGLELAENPQASLLFYWDKLERQVRIDGTVEKITAEESDEYFQTRNYTSRLGAWASAQSQRLPNRFTLLRKVASYMMKYPNEVPLPPFWGGYRLKPDSFEFWQGRESRLHDRILYSKSGDSWELQRLYP
jgi:pyridoxamine 5'-phosphate oxidase